MNYTSSEARFAIGELIQHTRFDYRGVVFDVDPCFQGTEEWYEAVAKSRPPRDQPWYHVMVDNAMHTTYVAERHLEAADDLSPINHPQLEQRFSRFENGRYRREQRDN